MQWIAGYITAMIVFGGLDACWLSWAAGRLYRPALGDLLAPQFRPVPAVVFYLAYLVGLVWFAVRPGIAGGWATAALNGALFGAFCYATYDLTNQATLVRWSTKVSIMDIVWGAFASAVAAAVAALVARRFA